MGIYYKLYNYGINRETLITLMKTLHDAKKNRNTIEDDVKIKNDAMQQVEVKHNKTRQRLAVLIWDGEKYLEEATKEPRSQGAKESRS